MVKNLSLLSEYKPLKHKKTMYTIQANPSGTRSLEISEENLATIEKYGLFRLSLIHISEPTRLRRVCSGKTETEYPLPHRITRGGQQRSARPLHRRDIPQQHESLRITTVDQALSRMAFQAGTHRRGIMK